MQQLHQHITSSGQKIVHMPIPKSTYNTLTRAVGKYTNILTGYANPQDMPELVINPRTGKQYSWANNPIKSQKRMPVAVETAEESKTVQERSTSKSAATQTTPVNIPAQKPQVKNAITSEEMAKTMSNIHKELQNSQAAALEAFKVEMQQEMACQMTIIKEMQSKLATSIQATANNGISQMQAAAFQAAPAIILPTPQQPVG
eukprot:15347752-Ditylum_brightwellii.AAC.1